MKNRLITLWIISIGLFIATGCTSLTPPQNEYRLDSSAEVMKARKTRCIQKTLKVDQASSDKLFMSLKIYYVQGKYAQYAYARSRWVESPNDKITEEITRYLRKIQLFRSVQNADSKTKNNFRLEINIEDFMQYFDKNEKNSYVNVVITCNLVDDVTHKIVATKTFHANAKTKSDNALGGVKALSRALNTILKQCGLWLQGVCLDK